MACVSSLFLPVRNGLHDPYGRTYLRTGKTHHTPVGGAVRNWQRYLNCRDSAVDPALAIDPIQPIDLVKGIWCATGTQQTRIQRLRQTRVGEGEGHSPGDEEPFSGSPLPIRCAQSN